jgi:PKD repeat protein
MTKGGRLPRVIAVFSVLMMLGSGLGVLAAPGAGGRGPGLDVAATGITSQKDIDDPSGSAPVATGSTGVTVAVKNTGDVNALGYNVQMEVGKNATGPRTVFYGDAESASLPAGWGVTNLTLGKWHTTGRTYSAGQNSAWCGPNGTAGVQYGPNWEEEMYTTSAISVPASNPMLLFSHLYSTKFATDGGYILIRDTSKSAGVWDHNGLSNWTFTQGNYVDKTASINPISKDTPCFTGDSSGWQNIAIELSAYAGKSILIKFIFSSSSTISGSLVGWFIDDVRVTDGATTTFSDGFESGMGKWTVNNMMGAVPTAWATLSDPSPSYNATSTRCFANIESVVNNTYYDGEDSALVTPDIPLSGLTNARLHFMYKMKAQSANDGGFVEAQKPGGDWVYLKPFMRNYPSYVDSVSCYGQAGAFNSTDPASPWTPATFDLSAFAGGTVKVRFHFFANADQTVLQGWFIDEVRVIAWKFDPVASDLRSIAAMTPGKVDNTTFTFNLSQEGYYSLKATIQLPGDTNPGNDMTYIIIEVRNVLTVDLSFGQSMPISVTHGRKAPISAIVWNTGNMINQVELKNTALPPGFSISYNRTVMNISAGAKGLFGIDVSVPVDAATGSHSFSVNATSRTDPARYSERKVELVVENNPPTAMILAQVSGLVFTPIVFDGSASSDPDNGDGLEALAYSWDFGDGTKGSGNTTTHSFSAAGRYTVTLNVSDGGPGSSSTYSIEINISDKEPVAIFDIDTPINNGTYQRDTEVVFNASRSRDESPARLNYTWDFGDQSEYGYDVVASHVYTAGGLFTVTLTVTDPGGQQSSNAKDVLINNPPRANISSPRANQAFFTTDDILFSSNGSVDPDDNPLTFRWEDNQLPDQVLSTSPFFSRTLSTTGRHIITLTVFDGKGPASFSYAQVTIDISLRQNLPPTLADGAVTPGSADEGTAFRYTVTYADPNGDVPDYVQVVIDGRAETPHAMAAVDLEDINFTDGKAYFFCTTALRGEDSPHSFMFITDDKHGSGKVSSETQTGPMVKWVRDLGRDSPDSTKIRGKVYQTGPYRTLLALQNNLTPDMPAGKLSLGLVFTMNTTAPPERWFWANITVLYSSFDYSKINESTLRIYQSVDGGAWTPVADSALDKDGQVLWMNVTRPVAKYAVFGLPVPTGPRPNGHTNETKKDDTMLYLAIAGAVVAVVVVAAAAVYLRRKPAVPPEPDIARVEEEPAGPRPERKWASADTVVRPEAMVGTTGEEVKVFRPAGGEVKVFRPGGEEKVFKPAETEEEEKIFRPGARDEVQEEAREPPVVEEEAPREKVVEYQEGAEEEASSMPGARPADKEVEESEEDENHPDKPAPPRQEPAKKRSEDESIDDLLDDLNK